MVFSEFSNKIVLVTGAAGGIGSAIVRGFLNYNALVYQTDLKNIDDPRFLRGDISDPEFIDRLVNKIVDKEGRIDILVNNAGICPRTPVMEISVEEWRKVMDINLTSFFLLSQAVMAVMIRNKSGAIINLASLAGKIGGITVGAHYSASKAAIECITKTFAKTGAQYGIRVNAVAPGVIDTEIHEKSTPAQMEEYIKAIPLGRMGKPEEVANMILVLASELSSYITGLTIDINGGQRMG